MFFNRIRKLLRATQQASRANEWSINPIHSIDSLPANELSGTEMTTAIRWSAVLQQIDRSWQISTGNAQAWRPLFFHECLEFQETHIRIWRKWLDRVTWDVIEVLVVSRIGIGIHIALDGDACGAFFVMIIKFVNLIQFRWDPSDGVFAKDLLRKRDLMEPWEHGIKKDRDLATQNANNCVCSCVVMDWRRMPRWPNLHNIGNARWITLLDSHGNAEVRFFYIVITKLIGLAHQSLRTPP